MYSYSYDYPSTGTEFVGFSVALTILALIAIIVAIVLTVVLYRKYAKTPGKPAVDFKDKSTWGPFLRFDTLIVDRVIRALYILCAVGFGLFQLAVLLASLALGFLGFLGMLILVVIVTVFVELLLRVQFELTMLNIVIARNTSDIKQILTGEEPDDHTALPSSPAPTAPTSPAPTAPTGPAPSAPSSPVTPVVPVAPSAPASPSAPVTPAPTAPAPAAPQAAAPAPAAPQAATPAPEQVPASEPAQQAPAQGGTVICPKCGAMNDAGAHFCLHCGAKLD